MKQKIQINSRGKKTIFWLTLAIILAFSFQTPSLLFAQEGEQGQEVNQHEVDLLNVEINEQRQKLLEIEKKKKDLQDQLNIIQRQTYSIQSQIASVDNQIQDTEFEIEKKTVELEEKRLEISKLEEEIEIKENEIKIGKEDLAKFIRIIDENDRVSPLYVLLSRDSFSSYIDDVKSSAELQVKVQQSVKNLKDAKETLSKQKEEVQLKENEIEQSRAALELNRETLKQQLEYQQKLAAESKSLELPYEQLIKEVSREQDYLDSHVRLLENKALQKILEQNKGIISNENVPLAWPISGIDKPGLNVSSCYAHITCSAYFGYDKEYFNGVYHYGVDIPVAQGTPVYSPADGFVAYPFVSGGVCPYSDISKCGGYTSQLYLQHIDKNGYPTDMYTAYFHLSKSVVSYSSDITFVKKGQLIGYAGGKRGTMGAGFSTGSHLHFAVSFGIPNKVNYVNPLNYLP